MTNIVVTGGSGFIGTHLVSKLLMRGESVVNIDIRPPRIESHKPYWINSSISDVESTEYLISKHSPTTIFNLAAETDITKGPEAQLVNLDGLVSLVKAVKKTASPTQLIHFSTQLTVAPGFRPTSDADMSPYSSYGASKAESERYLRDNGAGLRWTIVRPSTVWGAGHPTFGHGVWRYIDKGYYMLPTGIDPIRSYGYIANVVEQVLSIIDRKPELVDHQVFYVGDAPVRSSEWIDGFSIALTGKPVRRIPRQILYLLALAGELSGKIGGPSPFNLGRLERISTNYPVPMDKTFEVLCRGSISFEQGLKETIQWYRETDNENTIRR